MKKKNFNKYELKLLNFLKANKPSENTQIYLFGSRARRDHSRASDLDLAFLNLKNPSEISKIENKIEELNIPYHIDLVDLDQAPKELYNKCLAEGINIDSV